MPFTVSVPASRNDEITVLRRAPERILSPDEAPRTDRRSIVTVAPVRNVVPAARRLTSNQRVEFCRPAVPSVLLGVKPVVPGPVRAPVSTGIQRARRPQRGGQRLVRGRAGNGAFADAFGAGRLADIERVGIGRVGRRARDAAFIAGIDGRRRHVVERDAVGEALGPGQRRVAIRN